MRRSPDCKPWVPTQAGVGEPSNTILEVGNHVYQGGSQHYLHSYARSDYTFERGFITQNAGGDYQALAYKDGILYGSCHCVTDYQFTDTTNFSQPTGYSRVDPINLIGAYDTTNNLAALPEFHPTQLEAPGRGRRRVRGRSSSTATGACGPVASSCGRAHRPTPYYGGYEKFCDRDTTAPSVPSNVTPTVNGNGRDAQLDSVHGQRHRLRSSTRSSRTTRPSGRSSWARRSSAPSPTPA